MAKRLKNDWKPVGNSPAAAKVADWMNTVSNLFNFATVPSGGTAQATDLGFQIEVDSDGPYHFKVTTKTSTTVVVSGGWWAFYSGDTRTQVDLYDGSAGTITDYSDVTAEITVTASGYIYLELDNSSVTPTLTAKFAAAIPASAADVYHKKLATVTFADAVITVLKQDWRGGNILHSGGVAFDVRGTKTLYNVVSVRAYLTADNTIVAAGTAFNSSTMYLYLTYDWERWP